MRARPWLLAAVLASLTACGAREKAVKLALAVPLTGDMGSEGQGLHRAVELAVEEANAARIFPFRLELVLFDDRADPEEAVNVANLIIADPRIVAVIGHYNSGCAIAAAKVYARGPVAMITPSATNPEVTAQQVAPAWKWPRVAFRVVPTDDVQGAFAAGYAYHRLGRRRVAVIDDGTPYGEGLADRFEGVFQGLGGKIVARESVGESQDFGPELSRIKAATPDAVYFSGVYTKAGLALRQLRASGLKRTLFIAGDAAKTPGLFDVAGESADGAYLTTVGVPVELLPAARPFVAEYRERWAADPRPFDHFGYEAAQLVFDALERAGPDRVAVLEELRRAKHTGILGRMSFDERGDTKNRVITMTRARWRDRSFPTVD